jgi:hypothetical protein
VEVLNPLSLKGYHPGTGWQEAGNGFEQGGLPGPVASQQGDDFSFCNIESYSIQGRKISVKGINSFKLQQHICSESKKDSTRMLSLTAEI